MIEANAKFRWQCLVLASVSGCLLEVEGDSLTTFGDPTSPPSATYTSGPQEELTEGTQEGSGTSVGDDPETTTTDAHESASTTDGSDATGDNDDATGESGDSGDSDGGDDGSQGQCLNRTTCPSAPVLGTISGDQGSNSLDTSGTQPTWVSLVVTENDSSLIGVGMSMTASLTSPVGADFDLYVYRRSQQNGNACDGTMEQSTNIDQLDSVSMSWGESVISNGSDDDAWIAIEIRAKDDICVPPNAWSLTITGNT